MTSMLKQRASSLLLGVSIFCATLPFVSAPAFAQERPLQGTELKIGVAITPPFVFINGPLSDPQGIDVDVIRELQKRTGFSIANNQIEVMTFTEVLDLCAEGQLDVIGGGISHTESRSKIYDFSPSFYTTFTSIVAPKSSNIQDFPDLDNKSVAAEIGTTAVDLIPPEYNINVNVNETPSNFMSFYRVSRGLSDAMVVDEPLALYYVRGWGESNLEIKKLVPDSATRMGILFHRNPKINQHLTNAFNEMIGDGTLDDILEKHTGKNYKEAVGPFYEENLVLAGVNKSIMERRYQGDARVAKKY